VTFGSSRGLFSGWSTFTLELWIYPDYADANLGMGNEPPVVGDGGPINAGRLFSPTSEGPLVLQIDLEFSVGTTYPNMYVPQQTWSHIVYTFDGKTLLMYRNGTFSDLDQIGVATLGTTSSGSTFELGGSNNALTGSLDEVRVSKAYRGPDWIYAQHLAMTRHFITFAPGS
jgi:hypothetical protein